MKAKPRAPKSKKKGSDALRRSSLKVAAKVKTPQIAFWDTSALVPLCCRQPQSGRARQMARAFPRQIVWWGTPLEATGAIRRLAREGLLDARDRQHAFRRLDYLRRVWNEIEPTTEVREVAETILMRHALKSADALQLAAALVWCGGRPRGRAFIGSDGALLKSAEMEGFDIVAVM